MSEQEFNEQVREELRRQYNAPDVDTTDAEALREYVRRLEEAVFNLANIRNTYATGLWAAQEENAKTKRELIEMRKLFWNKS